MPSFDFVCEVNWVEIKNATDQASKEIATRFDFKGSEARIENKDKQYTLYADNDFQLGQVFDVWSAKLSKRQVDLRFLEKENIQKIAGDKVKQEIKIKSGIDAELAKKIVKLIKDHKLKVQASIQGDVVRVSGAKKDTLQECIELMRKEVKEAPLGSNNFRD
jgi:uncharacterized protein YajQ (UPF0234 family)